MWACSEASGGGEYLVRKLGLVEVRDLLGEEGGWQHPRPAVLCAKGDSFLRLPGDHGSMPFLGGAPLPLAGAALGYDPQCPGPLSWITATWSRCHNCRNEGGDLLSSRVGGKMEKRPCCWDRSNISRMVTEGIHFWGIREGKISEDVKIQTAFQISPIAMSKCHANPDLVTPVLTHAIRAGREKRGNTSNLGFARFKDNKQKKKKGAMFGAISISCVRMYILQRPGRLVRFGVLDQWREREHLKFLSQVSRPFPNAYIVFYTCTLFILIN